MTVEVIWTIALAIAGGLAFIAYNHPRQFFWISVTYPAFLLLLFPMGWLVQRVETMLVNRVTAADMLPDQKQIAIKAMITAPPTTAEVDLVISLVIYGAWYVASLGCLPVFGLTADAREARYRREYPKRGW